MDALLQRLAEQLPIWLDSLTSPAVIRQLLALVLVLLLAQISRRLIRRLLQRAIDWIGRSSLADDLNSLSQVLELLQATCASWMAWLLGLLAIAGLNAAGWESTIVAWVVPFLALRALYLLATGLIRRRMAPEQARMWSRQILRPLILGLAVLHGATLLDNVLAWGFRVSNNRVTLAALLAGGLLFIFFVLLSRGSRNLLGERLLPQAGLAPSLTQVLASFVAYAIIITGFMIALSVIGLPLTTFTVIAGGLSVGIGFGLQELISNFISGFILLFERSIGPGDVIQLGDTMGVVKNVGIRSMRILNLDNIEMIVPNNRFLTDVVTNYTGSEMKVRIHISVGVSYEARPREVEQALLEAARHELVLDEPAPSVLFTDFGDSSLNFDLLIWVNEPVRIPRVSSDLRYAIWEALAARHIEIPFPQRDIHIRSVMPIPTVASRDG